MNVRYYPNPMFYFPLKSVNVPDIMTNEYVSSALISKQKHDENNAH